MKSHILFTLFILLILHIGLSICKRDVSYKWLFLGLGKKNKNKTIAFYHTVHVVVTDPSEMAFDPMSTTCTYMSWLCDWSYLHTTCKHVYDIIHVYDMYTCIHVHLFCIFFLFKGEKRIHVPSWLESVLLKFGIEFIKTDIV